MAWIWISYLIINIISVDEILSRIKYHCCIVSIEIISNGNSRQYNVWKGNKYGPLQMFSFNFDYNLALYVTERFCSTLFRFVGYGEKPLWGCDNKTGKPINKYIFYGTRSNLMVHYGAFYIRDHLYQIRRTAYYGSGTVKYTGSRSQTNPRKIAFQNSTSTPRTIWQ